VVGSRQTFAFTRIVLALSPKRHTELEGAEEVVGSRQTFTLSRNYLALVVATGATDRSGVTLESSRIKTEIHFVQNFWLSESLLERPTELE
jgi:hypothetical protein